MLIKRLIELILLSVSWKCNYSLLIEFMISKISFLSIGSKSLLLCKLQENVIFENGNLGRLKPS